MQMLCQISIFFALLSKVILDHPDVSDDQSGILGAPPTARSRQPAAHTFPLRATGVLLTIMVVTPLACGVIYVRAAPDFSALQSLERANHPPPPAQAVLDPGEDLMDDASLEKREAEASQRSARSSKRSGPARGRTFAARLRAMRSPSSKRVAPEA